MQKSTSSLVYEAWKVYRLFAATLYTQYIRVITDEQPDIPSIREWRVKTDERPGLEDPFLSVDQMTCNHLRS